jgi:hypothetical protein
MVIFILIGCKKTEMLNVEINTKTSTVTNDTQYVQRVFIKDQPSNVNILVKDKTKFKLVGNPPANQGVSSNRTNSCSNYMKSVAYNCTANAAIFEGGICVGSYVYIDWYLISTGSSTQTYVGTTSTQTFIQTPSTILVNGDYYYLGANILVSSGGGNYYWTNDQTTVYHAIAKPAVTVSGTVPFVRYYNGFNHFYTANWCEMGPGKNEFIYEGAQCNVYETQITGTTAFYRFSKAGSVPDFFYVTNYQDGVNAGYTYDGIACYVYTSNVAGTTALYRFSVPDGRHFYTTNISEGYNAGFNLDGVACYVIPY